MCIVHLKATTDRVGTVNITPKIIPIKISVNPGVSLSHSINRTKYSLQDVDGDGYLDIVESDSEPCMRSISQSIGSVKA